MISTPPRTHTHLLLLQPLPPFSLIGLRPPLIQVLELRSVSGGGGNIRDEGGGKGGNGGEGGDSGRDFLDEETVVDENLRCALGAGSFGVAFGAMIDHLRLSPQILLALLLPGYFCFERLGRVTCVAILPFRPPGAGVA